MIEPVPLASADSADRRAVSADFSPLTWAFHWPWAALARLSSSVCAVFSSAVSVLSVLALSFTWMMSVAVTRSAATSAHTAASGDGARDDTLGPADGPADEDAADDGVLLGPHAAASRATLAMLTVSATARRARRLGRSGTHGFRRWRDSWSRISSLTSQRTLQPSRKLPNTTPMARPFC